MAITAQFLKNIMAEARPIIERQMGDAKLIAGFRDVVSANGGDWGALKALIKAHVEDENDETGEGKRVQKIRDKADSTSAYADMLGLANMNENNFSAGQSYAEARASEPVQEMHELPEGAATTHSPDPHSSQVDGGQPQTSSNDAGAKSDGGTPIAGQGGAAPRDINGELEQQSASATQTGNEAGSASGASAAISALVAQRIEQEVPNLSVAGSNPAERPTDDFDPSKLWLNKDKQPADKTDCLKLKSGKCKIGFATDALCSECAQVREKARVA